MFFASAGAGVGCISGILSWMKQSAYLPLLLAIFFYYVAYKSAVPLLKITPDQLPGGGRKRKIFGIWAFFFTWLLIWIVVYTYVLSL